MTTPRKKKQPEPDADAPLTIHDAAPADAPSALDAPRALTAVCLSRDRVFLEVATIPLYGAEQGHFLITWKGTLYSCVGPYEPDDPSREALRGALAYVEV